MKNIYVVVMRKYGDSDTHAYVLGAWKKKQTAIEHGKNEQRDRGMLKYIPFILEIDGKTGFPASTEKEI